jgi:hypothetical protein
MCSAHVDGQLIEAGELDREPLRTRYLVPTAGAGRRPHREANQEADMNRTISRWYPVLIMRDALGRFARLREALSPRPARRPSTRRRVQMVAVQLVLF